MNCAVYLKWGRWVFLKSGVCTTPRTNPTHCLFVSTSSIAPRISAYNWTTNTAGTPLYWKTLSPDLNKEPDLRNTAKQELLTIQHGLSPSCIIILSTRGNNRYISVEWPTLWLWKPGSSIPHSQGFSNNPYPEKNQPNFSVSLRSILNISFPSMPRHS